MENESIVEILTRRDGISEFEAENLVEECREAIRYASNIEEAEELIADYLGLEPDYLMELI